MPDTDPNLPTGVAPAGRSELDVADPASPDAAVGVRERKPLPMWLAVAVLIALIGGAVYAGFAVRGAIVGSREAQLQRIDAVERSRVAALATPVKERTHVDLAFAYEAAGKPASALAEYEAALKRNPNDVAGLYGRGTMLLKLGKDDEGISSLWKILLRDRGHVGAASALGSYYAQHGNYASVISAVRPAVLIHPEEAQLHYLMGLAYEHLGHTDWATARYRLALAADPDLIDARAALLRLTGAH